MLLTFIRWYYLVRALDLPFTLREALRLGFLGYLFNLMPMGIVGGDLLKAVMLGPAAPGRAGAGRGDGGRGPADRALRPVRGGLDRDPGDRAERRPTPSCRCACNVTLVLTAVGGGGASPCSSFPASPKAAEPDAGRPAADRAHGGEPDRGRADVPAADRRAAGGLPDERRRPLLFHDAGVT